MPQPCKGGALSQLEEQRSMLGNQERWGAKCCSLNSPSEVSPPAVWRLSGPCLPLISVRQECWVLEPPPPRPNKLFHWIRSDREADALAGLLVWKRLFGASSWASKVSTWRINQLQQQECVRSCTVGVETGGQRSAQVKYQDNLWIKGSRLMAFYKIMNSWVPQYPKSFL